MYANKLLVHLLLEMAWVSYVFTCNYSIFPFPLTLSTHVGGSNGVNTGPMKHWLPFLNNAI